MLERTFVHVPGIGATTEKSLWTQGCRNWHDYLAAPKSYSTGRAERQYVKEFLTRSLDALHSREHQFFASTLGEKQAWRAYSSFTDSCVYLDIETDGRAVTTIGMYDGSHFRCLIGGEDLENFRDEISRFSMIVTFCGTSFDLPTLQRRFRGLAFDQIHLDLCPMLRKLGFRGGLKRIEKELGIVRPGEVDGLNGFDAVVLWRRYAGLDDTASLERLIAYNREDCVNLEKLARFACQKMEAVLVDSDG